MYSKKITVFTPTYNRAYIIRNVYDSLCRQTYKDFEWLVIDDGSTDDTEAIIKGFISEKTIDIGYIKKSNGGKHTAWNMAIDCANGQMLMSVDSDDYLTDTALERVVYWENTIAGREGYAGVSGLRVFSAGNVIGDAWKHRQDYVDAANTERKKFKLQGDKAEAYYTDILRKFYPFPVFEGENFVPEGVLWNRIASGGYKIRWFNEGIYVTEYLKDGLTKNAYERDLNNFNGYICWRRELINMQRSYLGVVKELSEFTYKSHLKGYDSYETGRLVDRNILTVWLAKTYYKLHQLKILIQK